MGLAVPTEALGLILLLLGARETVGGAHSLCLNFTVRAQALPGKPWCEAQGSVDEKPFLQYDSDSNKDTPLGLLGEKVKDTQAWTYVSQTLEDVGRQLRMVLLVIKLEKSLSRGPLSLQGKLCCQRAAGQCAGASWEFNINGQKAVINTMNMTWTVIDAGARGIREEWENNQDLAEYFKRVSTVICCDWLKEFLEHWEKAVMPTETLLETPDTNQLPSNPRVPSISLSITIFFVCLIILVSVIMCWKHSAVLAKASRNHKRVTSSGQNVTSETVI